jgi:hypothetical protein
MNKCTKKEIKEEYEIEMREGRKIEERETTREKISRKHEGRKR